MIEPIARILDRCGSENSVLPPTELFNEGWMLRLVLDWLDRNRGIVHPLSFAPEARWYSEALLPSLFLPQSRGDIKAESFTHADGVIGHFSIASGERGDVKLLPGVKQFVVIEAKLGSTLSAGTKNVRLYRSGMTSQELYETARGFWRVGPRKDKAEYAIVLLKGIVLEVYRIEQWYPAGTLEYHTRDSSNFKNSRRWEFSGEVAYEIRDEYVDFLVGKGNQNPIRYRNV